MTHRGPFQPLLFCDSVISLTAIKTGKKFVARGYKARIRVEAPSV